MCGELGKKPDVPFKGTFIVRISPGLHRQATIASNFSLNAFVGEAIKAKLEREQDKDIASTSGKWAWLRGVY
ncbi:toxin-antitoxin system HicB family antitoxin [Oligella urethralis]|uniref:toxin-antitoxin system HicB family antitoxin n=1 Tax=Oligella urethralis TaxID=90245 RepID=UPI001CECD82B|nr:toxin-antitoxin system HicB family antitoxin [Oligella urethralis]